MSGSQKDLHIESLRGLAVILMVTGHVIGSGPSRGMQVPLDSLWHLGFVGLQDIRMPLFTLLSGFVYGYRPLGSMDRYADLVRGKIQRLLIPLAVVGTLYFLVQALVPGTNVKPALHDLWRLYVYGHDHLWFLQSIFLIFLLVGLLDGSGVLRDGRRFALVFAVAAIGFLFHQVPGRLDVFSVGGFLRLLPFFLAGYALNGLIARPRPTTLVALLAASLGLVGMHLAQVFSLLPRPGPWPWDLIQSFVVGLAACLSLFFFRNQLYARPLAWIGQFSFAIYLLHVFGSAATRLVLGSLGIQSHGLIFLACMTAAVGLPILFELTFGRIALLSRLFLGQRPSRPLPGWLIERLPVRHR